MKILFSIMMLLSIGNVYPQACGSGIFRFEFYTINGEKVKLDYEVIELNDENLKTIMLKSKIESIYNAAIVDSKIIDSVNFNKITKDELPFQNKVKRKGNVLNGILEFRTKELANIPCLLKIKTDKYIFYLMANLFGGCNRKNIITLGKQPIVDCNIKN